MRKQKPLTTYEDTKEKALRLLEYRSHSEHELTVKLLHFGADREHIESVLEFCRRYGFVNDKTYAQGKARDLVNLKKYGIRRVRSELKSKGIADDIIEEMLLDFDNDKESEALTALVEKKIRGDFSDKNRDKCIRYFIYRGYDFYDIKNAIELCKERNDFADDV